MNASISCFNWLPYLLSCIISFQRSGIKYPSSSFCTFCNGSILTLKYSVFAFDNLFFAFCKTFRLYLISFRRRWSFLLNDLGLMVVMLGFTASILSKVFCISRRFSSAESLCSCCSYWSSSLDRMNFPSSKNTNLIEDIILVKASVICLIRSIIWSMSAGFRRIIFPCGSTILSISHS